MDLEERDKETYLCVLEVFESSGVTWVRAGMGVPCPVWGHISTARLVLPESRRTADELQVARPPLSADCTARQGATPHRVARLRGVVKIIARAHNTNAMNFT